MSSWESTSASKPDPESVPGRPPSAVSGSDAVSGSVDVPEAGESAVQGPEDVDDLAGLERLPLAEHPAVFERVHAQLQGALSGIDSA